MRPSPFGLVGLGAISAVTLARALVLASPGVPVGVDGGNWLAFGSLVRPGMVYPPLVPLLFIMLATAVGPTLATVLAAAAAAAAPGLAIVGIAGLVRRPVIGAIAALAAVGSLGVGEAAAWGGYPQLLALAAAMGAIAAAAVYLVEGRGAALVAFGALFAGVVATSHLEAFPALGAVGLLAVWSWATAGSQARRPLIVMSVAALPFIALAPIYGELLATLGGPSTGAPDPGRILGATWPVYFAVLALAPCAFAVVVLHRPTTTDRRELAMLAAGATAALAWGAAFVISGEPRLIHDVAALAPLAGVVLAGRLLRPAATGLGRIAPFSVGVVAVAFTVSAGLAAFPAQVAYYQILGPAEVSTFRWLGELPATRPGEILVADVRGVPLGWWAEGLARREVLFAADLRWLRFASESAQARLANAILYGSNFPAGASRAASSSCGVRYVVLPRASAFGLSAEWAPAGWRVAFAASDMIVLSPAAGFLGADFR